MGEWKRMNALLDRIFTEGFAFVLVVLVLIAAIFGTGYYTTHIEHIERMEKMRIEYARITSNTLQMENVNGQSAP